MTQCRAVLIGASLFAVAFTHLAIAESSGCVQINNDLDRLACYDNEAGRTPETTPHATPGLWNWDVRSRTSEMTDQTDVFVSARSDAAIDCGWNHGAVIILTLRCVENTTALVFETGCHMTSSEYDGYGDVMIRIDNQPAHTVGMEASTNNKALGLWSGATAIPEIKKMFGGKKLVARMTPFSESAFISTFDISGVERIIEPLRKACGW